MAGSIPASIAEFDGKAFDIAATATSHEQIPHPEWRGVHAWVECFGEEGRAAALLACTRSWLGMLAQALGPDYRVFESDAEKGSENIFALNEIIL